MARGGINEAERIVVTDDLRFGRYNFHREETIEAVVRGLASAKASKVFILSGPEGSGRRYLWSSALHRLAQKGADWEQVDFDLDGFEPDADVASQRKFISLLLGKQDHGVAEGGLADGAQSLAEAMGKVPGPIGYTATGLAILLGARKHWTIVERLLHSREPRGTLPNLPGDTWLSQLLEDLAREKPLALFCREPDQLTASVRRILMQVSDGSPRLALALPALESDSLDSLWPRSIVAPIRVKIAPLERHEVQSMFARRFNPNRCPAKFVDALWSATDGRPSDIASRIGDLIVRNRLQQDSEGCWYLSGDGLEDKVVVGQFKVEFLQPLYSLLERFEPEIKEDLIRFLATAALCGDFVPVKAVMRYLDLPSERTERTIDLVDTYLVCSTGQRHKSFSNLVSEHSVPFFDDLEYHHAGFPDQPVYRFRSPLIRGAIRSQQAFCNWETTAAAFLSSLQVSLPTRTRAAAEVHLSVVTSLGDVDRRNGERRLLSWWVGRQESEVLEEVLVEQLGQEILTPESLWSVVVSDLNWPPHRCLALVNAYGRQPGGPPLERLPPFHLRRATLLAAIGEFRSALVDARLAEQFFQAGNIHGRVDHDSLGRSLYLVGFCLSSEGQFAEARPWYERAVAAMEQGDVHDRVDHGALGSSLHQVGHCLSSEGLFAEARRWFERAVAAMEQGDMHGRVDHGSLGRSLDQVGFCLSSEGLFAEARRWFERAVAAKEQGDVHGCVDHGSLGSSLHLVGYCLSSEGQFAEARPWFERAVAAKEQGDVHGRVDHGSLGASLHQVGYCLSSEGQFGEARPWFERAIAAAERGDLHGRVDHADLQKSRDQLALRTSRTS